MGAWVRWEKTRTRLFDDKTGTDVLRSIVYVKCHICSRGETSWCLRYGRRDQK
jgi:hypothetical protein